MDVVEDVLAKKGTFKKWEIEEIEIFYAYLTLMWLVLLKWTKLEILLLRL